MSKICTFFMILFLITACSKEEKTETLAIIDDNGTEIVYNIEVAKTKEELSIGLMNRKELKANHGMIFDLSTMNNNQTAMWMKNTKIALDMLFIDEGGMIYWIYENAQPNSTKLIVPPYKAFAVLEINGGEAQKNNIQIGNMVKYKMFEEKQIKENQ